MMLFTVFVFVCGGDGQIEACDGDGKEAAEEDDVLGGEYCPEEGGIFVTRGMSGCSDRL